MGEMRPAQFVTWYAGSRMSVSSCRPRWRDEPGARRTTWVFFRCARRYPLVFCEHQIFKKEITEKADQFKTSMNEYCSLFDAWNKPMRLSDVPAGGSNEDGRSCSPTMGDTTAVQVKKKTQKTKKMDKECERDWEGKDWNMSKNIRCENQLSLRLMGIY